MIDFSSLPDKAPAYDLRTLLEAGCHFGHQSRKWHPHMKPFIYMEKDGIHIFDLAKTAEQLKIAYNYAFDLGRKGKTLIIIGTKRQARDIIKEQAQAAGVMYIGSRWLGGTLTNWEQVQKSLARMKKLEKGLASGAFDNYTKFERMQMEKELGRLQRFFEGLKELKGKPDALFIIDPVKEKIALREAVATNVPVLAMVDSNADPRQVDVAIPANDDAVGSIQLIVSEVLKGYKEGKNSK